MREACFPACAAMAVQRHDLRKVDAQSGGNWPAAAIVSSEGGAVLGGHSLGKDSAMRTMSAINELWSGSPLTIDRATSDSCCVRNARLTVGLQVQPSVLASFMERERISRGSGFLARFLFSAPVSTQGRRQFPAAPQAWRARDPFNARVAELRAIMPNIDADGRLCLCPIRPPCGLGLLTKCPGCLRSTRARG